MRVGLIYVRVSSSSVNQTYTKSILPSSPSHSMTWASEAYEGTTHTFVNTLLAALCMTAICPAFELFPRTSFLSSPVSGEWASLYTSTPSRISFHRIHEMLFRRQLKLIDMVIKRRACLYAHFTTPALATDTKGTSLPRSCFADGETFRRGTNRVRETAIRTDVAVAAVYADLVSNVSLRDRRYILHPSSVKLSREADLPVPIS